MAYTITRTNGQNPIVIPDGQINTQTSVILVGKNYPNYGSILGQNFLKLLENSANGSPPTAPVVGELWWGTTSNTLQIWTGTIWKNVGSTTSSSTQPDTATSNVGDLWWNTASSGGQLYGFDGATYKLIGPIGGAAGVSSETIIDSGDTGRSVLTMTIGNYKYAILSASAAFVPQTPIPGFQTIYPGLNIANTSFLSNAKFYGQANDSATLTGIAASQFMRNDVITTSLTGNLNVLNNNGLNVGTANNLNLSIIGANSVVSSQTSGGVMNFRVKSGAGATLNAVDIYPNGNLVANYDLTVTGNLNFSNSALNFIVTATEASTGTTTGALRVPNGGTSIGGNINTGGSNNNFVGQVRAATIVSNSSITGATIGNVGTLLTGTLQTPAQTNVTSLGTLTGLTVAGAISATTVAGTLTTNAQPYINSVGTLSALTVSGATNLGAQSNLTLTGGSNGQFLKTNGSGVLTWGTVDNSLITGTNTRIAYFGAGSTLTSGAGLTYDGANFYVSGGGLFTGDITAYYSDDRLKTRIGNIENALDKVGQLNGFYYEANALANDLGYATKREVGVSAQEIQNVLPEVVGPAPVDANYLTVKYERIIPLLIEAIKELKSEIEILKSK